MYFKVREYVYGYYDYAIPLDENTLKEINEYIEKTYKTDVPLTIEDLEEIAVGVPLPPRYASYCYNDYRTGEPKEHTLDLNTEIYSLLCDWAWDYALDDGFNCSDTAEVDRQVGKSPLWWED